MTDHAEHRVRIDWIPSPDFDVEGFYGCPEPEQTRATDELRENLRDGVWRAEDAIAYVTCASCGKESIGASLHWIVTGYKPEDEEYRQQIEAELRAEALENEKDGALQ